MIPLFKTVYTVEVVSADALGFLTKLRQADMILSNVSTVNELKLRFSVPEGAFSRLCVLAAKNGADVQIVSKKGFRVCLRQARVRWVLIAAICILTAMTLYLPSRVLFVSVEGNEHVNATVILDKAELCGISFGASRKEVRSERMKNALLQAVPELKWAGINTYGCTAVISVLERDLATQEKTETDMVQGIYAVRDGIVQTVTATKGTALCKPGQAVQAGQLLISGYTDCGLVTRAEQAEGEVYAQTQRILTGIYPTVATDRSKILDESVRYSLQFGKKRIKLYNDSGNLAPSCGKIYETIDLTLPGGFQLPVSLVVERIVQYGIAEDPQPDPPAEQTLCALAERYITNTMIAGQIAASAYTVAQTDGGYCMHGAYACVEMIGKVQNEEIR